MTASKAPYNIRLINDYPFDEVASALQKSIRRGHEYDACYWAFILHESGYYKYVWKRLMIIASEDIGNGTPLAAILVHSLQQSYQAAITSQNRPKNDALQFIMQACMFLSRAEKSREADSVANLIRTNYGNGEYLEVPDYAVDVHTQRGRAVHGRWGAGTHEEDMERHRKWYDIWSKVSPDVGDRYVKQLRKAKGVGE